jgi:hypothetical protein
LPPEFIKGVQLNDTTLTTMLKVHISRAANSSVGVVFCPPIATFNDLNSAATENLVECPAIAVELDEHPNESLRQLIEVLGQPTAVIASGGVWVDPETGEEEDKLHGYWRLAAPTQTQDEHRKLHRARKMAAKLVGADESGVALVHPMRWPGSWHTKNKDKPRLAHIVQANPDVEVDLDAVLAALGEVVDDDVDDCGSNRRDGDGTAYDPEMCAYAVGRLADWRAGVGKKEGTRAEWIRIGMAIKAAFADNDERGLELWDGFSKRCEEKYNETDTGKSWRTFNPTAISAASIIWSADEDSPGWREDYDAMLEEAVYGRAGERAIDAEMFSGVPNGVGKANGHDTSGAAKVITSVGHDGETGRDAGAAEAKAEDHDAKADTDGQADAAPKDVHDDHDVDTNDDSLRSLVLSEDAFHGLAGEVARAFVGYTEGAPAAILIQFLVYAGAMFGRCRYVLVEGSKHFPNLMVLVLGRTASGRKGISHSRARQVITATDPLFVSKNVKKGLSTGEGLIHVVRDARIEWDEEKKCEVVVDKGVDDKRVVFYEPEFASLLKRAERSGNSVTEIMRDAFDGDILSTQTRANPLTATGAHIAGIFHITPKELEKRLASVDLVNGFINRMTFVGAARVCRLPFGGDNMPDGVVQKLGAKLMRAIEAADGRHPDNIVMGKKPPPPPRVDMTPAARALWEKAYVKLTAPRSGLLEDVLARNAAQTLRYALIYTLLDEAEQMDVAHLKAGLAICEYSEKTAKIVFGDKLGDSVADEILEGLRASPAGMSRTEIFNSFDRHTSRDRITNALRLLFTKKLARMESKKTAGRPVEMWFATRRTGSGN